MRTLMSEIAVKTWAAMPGRSRMFSPTRQTMALRPTYFTNASFSMSAAISGMRSLESTVSETLTSEVETTSTAHLWRSKISKICRRKPCAMSMRAATTSMTVMRFLAAMALNGLLRVRRAGDDLGALVRGIARVENVDRNVLLDGRQHGGGVQDLGAEVGEFGGFFEADDLDAVGIGTEVRVGGLHAVDVGPDLDGVGVEAGADKGGGEIGATAADGGGDAIRRAADEAAEHRHCAGFDQGAQMGFETAVDLVGLRNRRDRRCYR